MGVVEYFVLRQMPRRWVVGLWAALSVVALWGLICLYSGAGTGASFGTAAVYVVLMSAGAAICRFASAFLDRPAVRAALLLSIFLSGLGVTWGVAELSGWHTPEGFVRLSPLLALFGVSAWTVLTLSIRRSGSGEREQDSDPPAPLPEKRDAIDRVSVKKGQEIHIVRVEELLYVQAEGDYVLLFTHDSRFLKEQTMRWFEEHLPAHFVRIHRSAIVNIDRIARVELFGKENYHVRLKNGAVLKASVNGYRTLKARLEL